jgi:hypothetical protein
MSVYSRTNTKPSFDPDETTGGFAHSHDPFLVHHNGTNFYGIPKRPSIPV